ncbi:hypothetical protein OG986_14135 [Streptomyces cellulosae]|uniref:Secreted protein n=2 Tax=Streptomyces TaxID=1883 RepID=A0ABU3JB64_9ACTN|nr:hypothetical protein [Streptomyces sp. McG7]MDQ0488639.1 hypothetical protein [Streptomyces thermodiastaticus]MDT6971016.1 hypothetical protein [Streptomyces thermocarboxydus]THC47054.1 hypothetical protein E7X38_33650 [Streptomyces sp. Akac8]WSB41989.1 hypothetical protein OG853_14470 [Streptomyces cellulosae]
MTSRGKTLKLTAVSALVVLTLTGFSTGRGHGGSSGHHDGDSGGGGCSSSSQNHDSSSGGSHRDYDDDDYDDDYGSSGGSGGSEASMSPDAATVTLVECVSEQTPYATVEVTNDDTVDGTFSVTVVFKDAAGEELTRGTEEVLVPAGETTTAEVPVDDETSLPQIDECELDSYAPAA